MCWHQDDTRESIPGADSLLALGVAQNVLFWRRLDQSCLFHDTHLLTSPGRAETELIFTVLHIMNHVIRGFNCIRDYASMTIAAELDTLWCLLQIEIINTSTRWYTTHQKGACTGHEGDHSFKAAAISPLTPTELYVPWTTEAWRLCGDCQGCVLRILPSKALNSNVYYILKKSPCKRPFICSPNRSTVAKQTSATLRSSPKAAYLLCINQPLQVIKFCFCICSTTVPTSSQRPNELGEWKWPLPNGSWNKSPFTLDIQQPPSSKNFWSWAADRS